MERKALIICPCCKRVRKFGVWIELSYAEKMQVNSFVIEEIKRICDDCQTETQKRVHFASTG